MKICIPVMGQQARLSYFLANDFYKANDYCLYHLKSGEMEYLSKADLMDRFGLNLREGGGDDAIVAILSPNIHPLAYKILSDNNISVYRPSSNLIEENIESLKKGCLELYDPADISRSSGCGSSCSSCSSGDCPS
jgi:predicted Fe-Mo cluster-binding NifX family protein